MTHRTFAREIAYDPEARDFAMTLDGNLVGFARSYQEAEAQLDALVHDILRQVTVDLADEQAERDAEVEARAWSCPSCGSAEQVFIGGAFRCLCCGQDITRAVQHWAADEPQRAA